MCLGVAVMANDGNEEGQCCVPYDYIIVTIAMYKKLVKSELCQVKTLKDGGHQ